MSNNEKVFNALNPLIIALLVAIAVMIIVLILCCKRKKRIMASAFILLALVVLFVLSNVAQSELQGRIIRENFFDGEGIPITSFADDFKKHGK